MPNKRTFIKQFWKEKKMIGSMVPSSRFLAQKMLENVDFENARIIVELGPGTGVFTDLIIEKMHPDAQLLVFELNENFHHRLAHRITDKRVHCIHDTAEKVQDYLKKIGHEKADVVISSLPLSNFSKELRHSILSAMEQALQDTGQYIQFQYSLQSKKQIKQFFETVNIDFTALNFPPAFVYSCYKTATSKKHSKALNGI